MQEVLLRLNVPGEGNGPCQRQKEKRKERHSEQVERVAFQRLYIYPSAGIDVRGQNAKCKNGHSVTVGRQAEEDGGNAEK